MPKQIESLVEDIYAILDEDNDHTVSEENVEWAGEALKALLRTRLQARTKGGDPLRFSSLGKTDRKLWYEANMPEAKEKFRPQAIFKFLYGDVIELLLLFLSKEAGHTVTHEQYTVEADGVIGHMDACIDEVPVDCKSASPYSFAKFKSGEFLYDDPFGYIRQLSGYAHAIERTDRAAFLVSDKVGGDIALAFLDAETIGACPPEPRIAHLREVIASPEPPIRCYPDVPEGKSGNMKLGVGCSYCPFHDECWKDANGGRGLRKYIYSRGPVWLTTVAREPKVEEA